MSEGTLATLFSPYGLLERCKIVVDLQTLRSRGYGFVKYDNQNSAERAMKALNGYELNGKKLKVAFARQQCKAITNANLYITNIPTHFESENLYKLFQDYGKIIECNARRSPTPTSTSPTSPRTLRARTCTSSSRTTARSSSAGCSRTRMDRAGASGSCEWIRTTMRFKHCRLWIST